MYFKEKEKTEENRTGIPLQLKRRMEEHTGLSFQDVQVHYNSEQPGKINALAYTQGTQVYLAPGEEKHLPHELGHVVQQKQGIVKADTMYPGGVCKTAAVESTLDESVKAMGAMTKDTFYKLEDQNFAGYIEKAIAAHKNWLSNLERIVRERTIMPLQVNDRKCGFGHFYYAIEPARPEVVKIRKELGAKHKKFHSYGKQAIDALFDGDYNKAENICREARQYSDNLIHDLEQIKELSIRKSNTGAV